MRAKAPVGGPCSEATPDLSVTSENHGPTGSVPSASAPPRPAPHPLQCGGSMVAPQIHPCFKPPVPVGVTLSGMGRFAGVIGSDAIVPGLVSSSGQEGRRCDRGEKWGRVLSGLPEGSPPGHALLWDLWL